MDLAFRSPARLEVLSVVELVGNRQLLADGSNCQAVELGWKEERLWPPVSEGQGTQIVTRMNVKSRPRSGLQERNTHAQVPREGPDSDALEESSLAGIHIPAPLMLGMAIGLALASGTRVEVGLCQSIKVHHVFCSLLCASAVTVRGHVGPRWRETQSSSVQLSCPDSLAKVTDLVNWHLERLPGGRGADVEN